jgi:protein-tyrosine phosphatase
MFDLHCHFLPAIDDGPASLDEALLLARLARNDGITHAVVTPHIHPGRYENERGGIERAVIDFARHLRSAGIDISIAAGAEVRLDPMILPLLQAGQIPFIGRYGDEDIVLLEFPHSHIPPGTEKFIAWMRARKIRPLIAHPERNKDVLRKLEKIQPFVDMGCLLQVTAGAVAGMFGEPARGRAVAMLERGWVSILATDAHDTSCRIPAMTAGFQAAANVVGEQEALRMVLDRPREWVAHRFRMAHAA